ncbi:MAG: isoprenyl transferase [Rhodospirillaceae bacterium]
MDPVRTPEQTDTPLHVAIIMDGNGRWARARGLPRTAGHKRGAEAVRASVKAAKKLGVTHLTLFGFSSENWKRPASEVTDLMGLLRLYLRNEVKDLDKNGVRFRVIGERDRFSDEIRVLFEDAEERTRTNNDLHLTIALNYGGRAELVRATRSIAEKVKDGSLDLEAIDEDLISSQLFTNDMPDPDVLVRTSGEQRISNFLLWQCAYTEFVFLPVLWPDFGHEEMAKALDLFRDRVRRFGGL